MMALSLPSGGLNNLDTNMKIANEFICIFGSEDCLQSISKENMDQIRNTMMRHEALFKEQVQALHNLYNIQKSAMQEIRKAIYSKVQVLAFSSDSISDRDGQLHSSVVEGKPLRPAYVTSQAYMEESHVLSLHPSCAVKELTGCAPKTSFWMNDTEVKTLPNVQNKPRREIDLEKPPEDYMDESDIQIEANNYGTPDANTSLYEGTRNTFQVSFVGSNSFALQVDSPSLNQRDPRPDNVTPSEPSQEIHRDCERASETKIDEVYTKKCTAGIQSLDKAFQNNILQDFPCNHLSAFGNLPVYEESNPPPNQRAEKPLWLHQGASAFTAQVLNSTQNSVDFKELQLETASEQTEKISIPDSTQVCQSLESNCLVTTSHLKLDEQQQKDSADAGSLSTNRVIFSQSSSTLKQCGSKSLNSLSVQGFPSLETKSVSGKENSYSWAVTYQTSEDGGNENPNCSGHGSNSDSQDGKVSKDGELNVFTIESGPKFGADCGESIPMSQVTDGVQSELEEAPLFHNIGIEPSLSSSVPGFETNHVDHDNFSNGSPETVVSQEEPAVVTESNEDPKNESTLEEACESIAAKILLSFAPDRTHDDTKEQGFQTQIEAESNRSSRDVSGHDRKRSLRARKSVNYSNGDVMDETEKWTKSVHGRRRRTSRRPK